MPSSFIPPFYYGKYQINQQSKLQNPGSPDNVSRQRANFSQNGTASGNFVYGRPESEKLSVFNGEEIGPPHAKHEYDKQRNPETGYLKLRVTTVDGIVPVYGAAVTIIKCQDPQRRVVSTQHTDYNGVIGPIPLPAPDQTPTWDQHPPKPYVSYTVLVEHPEYREAEAQNIPVFAGITSVQQVRMAARFPAAGAYPSGRHMRQRG